MDVPAPLSLESRKRARDGWSSLASDDGLAVQEPFAKRVCDLDVGDVSVCSILDNSSEAIALFDQSELDEAQEELVCDVMRSLEQELVSSNMTTAHTSRASGQNMNRWLPVREEYSFSESPSSSEEPSTSKAETDTFELIPCLDAESDFSNCRTSSKPSTSPCAIANEDTSREAGTGEAQKTSCGYKSLDIGFLLAASDDELGILPSPGPDSLCSRADITSDGLPEMSSLRSENDSIDLESWFLSMGSESEDPFGLEDSGESYTTEEWQKILSPVEIV